MKNWRMKKKRSTRRKKNVGLGVRLIPENWACNAKEEVGLGEMFVYGIRPNIII